jgi:beta-glucosidase
LQAVLEANPDTVVVMQSGMPVEMPWVDKCPTLLQSWYGGNEQGNAIASVIFGHVAPQGRLPLTYPKSIQDCPNYLTFPQTHHNGSYGTVDYNEGSDVGYRYYSKTQRPVLFEFGHGLSYSTFEWGSLQLLETTYVAFDSKTDIMKDSVATVDMIWKVQTRITNKGSRPSKEVIQLYSSRKENTHPTAEMRHFATTKLLQPGEHEDVTFLVRLSELSTWDETYLVGGVDDFGCWHAAPGTYTLCLGRSCQKMETNPLQVCVDKLDELRWKGLVTRFC